MRIFSYLLSFAIILFWGGISDAALSDVEVALMNKDYAQVRDLSQEILKSTAVAQERTMAQYYLGLSQLRLGQYAEARKAFWVVKSSFPNKEMYDKAALGMLEGLYMAGFYKDALKEGEALLRKSPDSQLLSLVYLKLARANLKLMQWQKAREYLTRIVERFPSSLEYPMARQLLEEKEYFTVQVGAFLEQSRALRLADELKAGGQYAYMVETTSPEGRKFFRVRAGQVTSLDEAQTLEVQLSKLGYPTRIYP